VGDGGFVCCSHFLPPIPNVFSGVIFQLNCNSFAGVDGPSSVSKSITMSALPGYHLGDLDGEDELSNQELHE
jgi:hypothetical protein